MNVARFKPLLEIVGVVAIIVSLLLLTYELKRANEIAEAEATSTVYEMANQMIVVIVSDQRIRQTFLKTYSDNSEALTDDEKILLFGWWKHSLNLNEVAWKYNQLGLMSDEDIRLRFSELCDVLDKQPMFAKDWENRGNTGLPGFYGAVSEVCKLEAK